MDANRAQVGDEFTGAMDRDGTILVDIAGMAKEQNGKCEAHGRWFEHMLTTLIQERQPQDESEWMECVSQLQEAKNSMLSVGGVSPAQIVFGRNPEVPEDLLQESPDLVANSCVLHDPIAQRSACIRAASRRIILAHNEKESTRRALDSRPRVLRTFQPGEMVAVWRSVNQKKGHKMHHYRWRPGIVIGAVRGNYWIALPGSVVKASPEQMRLASAEERTAWRLVESELRTYSVNLDDLHGSAYYQDITKGPRPSVAEEGNPEAWEPPPTPDSTSESHQPFTPPTPAPPTSAHSFFLLMIHREM